MNSLTIFKLIFITVSKLDFIFHLKIHTYLENINFFTSEPTNDEFLLVHRDLRQYKFLYRFIFTFICIAIVFVFWFLLEEDIVVTMSFNKSFDT